ncbi:hypothetical protein EV363DRAFT_1322555 [Boletus edulis]|nr:hypothetical protein EV363DRAFT_1322555 [Boletus edulis]
MILRVWGMYNQSRLIIGTLLTTFSLEMMTSTIALTRIQRTRWRLPSVILCAATRAARLDQRGYCCSNNPRYMLAIVQFVRQSFQMYRRSSGSSVGT